MKLCPCGSQKPYANCCDRYISGAKPAPIAEALMRSRYTAYTLGNVDYIMATWAAETRNNIDVKSLTKTCQETQYLGLKIISKNAGTRKQSKGQVEFEVSFKSFGKTQIHCETSNFIKIANQWYYLDGIVTIY